MSTEIGGSIYSQYGTKDVLSQFPETPPQMNFAGLDTAPDIQAIDTQVYNVDIFQDYKVLNATGAPIQTIWFTIGGETIKMPYAFWTDEYTGEGYVTVYWDHLRLRDKYGYNNKERSYRVGEAGELGGKIIWQKCCIAADGGGTAAIDDFDQIDDGSIIHIMVPKSTSNWHLDRSEIKEIAPVVKGDKKLVALGFSREGASSRFASTVGHPDKVIEMIENTCRARDYVGYDNMSVTWKRYDSTTAATSAPALDSTLDPETDCKTVSYLFDSSAGSRKFHLMFNNIEFAKQDQDTSYNTVFQFGYAHRFVGVDQFIFTKDMTEFIIVLDFGATNIDFLACGTPVALSSIEAGGNAYVQITDAVMAALPYETDATPTTTYLWPGEIARHIDASYTFTHASAYGFKTETTVLIEEVNTAPKITSGSEAYTDRIFSMNIGIKDSNGGGTTAMSPFLAINLHETLPPARHEMEGFDTEEKTGYKVNTMMHHNFTRIHHSKKWTISMDAMNTDYRVKGLIEKNRRIYLADFQKDWNNIFLYEKGQNLGDYMGWKGYTSGYLDRERFPIKYAFLPIPTELAGGTIAISDASAGMVYQKWLEDYQEIQYGNRQPSESQNVSVAIGKDLKNMIRRVNSAISTQTSNVFGWNLITQVPKNELYLGIPTWQYDVGGKKINFFEDPTLNDMVDWKLPYYLFPNANGKASPRFLMLGFDKSNVGIVTRAGRQEKVHGNLQPRTNPFIYTEAVSSAHMVKVRFAPTNHSIVNHMPNYWR